MEVEAAREEAQSISVASLPIKTSYTVGDRLDTTGLTVRVVTNKQVKDVTEGFSCTPVVLSSAGRQTIKVVYGVQSTSFEVTVAERATATPAPTATPVPTASAGPGVSANPSPSASPHSSSHQSHETSAGSAFLQIVLVLALFALVGLGAYVFVVQRKNKK